MKNGAMIACLASLACLIAFSAFPYSLRNQVYPVSGSDKPAFIHHCNNGAWSADASVNGTKVFTCVWKAGDKEGAILSEETGYHLCVAASGLIAFVNTAATGESGANPATTLSIMDAAGRLVRSMQTPKTIRDLDWCPSGIRLAIVIGLEGDETYWYDSAETLVFSPYEDKTEKIADAGARVRWARFDGNIYIYDQQSDPVVQRYEPATHALGPTRYKDINFSPDGTYYYMLQRHPWDGLEIFIRETNTPLSQAHASAVSPVALKHLGPRGWLNGRQIICIVQTGSAEFFQLPTYVLNIDSGEVRQAHRFILNRYTNDSVVVRRADGSHQIERIASMPIIQPEDIAEPTGLD